MECPNTENNSSIQFHKEKQKKKKVNVKVEYGNIPPEERVFEIDTQKMEEAVGVMFGKRKANLTVEVCPGLSGESGHYRNGKIVVWQDQLVQIARHWYGCAQISMGENPNSSYFIEHPKESWWNKLKREITFMPHKLAKVEGSPLLTEEQQAASEEIFEMVRTSGDVARGKDMTGELVEQAFKRSMAETLAHETGHAVNRKKLLISGIGIYLTAGAIGLLTAQGLAQVGAGTEVVLASVFGAPILGFGGVVLGEPIVDEKLAEKAQKKFFSLFIEAININWDVFERKVMSPNPT